MKEEKKNLQKEETKKKGKELSEDELNDVAGGSLKNAAFNNTKPISQDTKDKI